MGWIVEAQIDDGLLLRPISKSGRALLRRLAPEALRHILQRRLDLAGLPAGYASLHGLCSGFLTQAALAGAPLAAAMKLSLHRAALQAQRCCADVEITYNPATDLLG